MIVFVLDVFRLTPLFVLPNLEEEHSNHSAVDFSFAIHRYFRMIIFDESDDLLHTISTFSNNQINIEE